MTIQFSFDVAAPTVVKPELAVVGVQKADFVHFAVDPADDTELLSFCFSGMVLCSVPLRLFWALRSLMDH